MSHTIYYEKFYKDKEVELMSINTRIPYNCQLNFRIIIS